MPLNRPLVHLEEPYLLEMAETTHVLSQEMRRAGHYGLAHWAKNLEVEVVAELSLRFRLERELEAAQLRLL